MRPVEPTDWQPFPPVNGAAAPGAPASRSFGIGKFLNRDLSWLAFNDRVLAEAADRSVPPLERLRFAAIVSSNLDEFFMVRVAEIQRVARRYPLQRSPDGLTSSQVLAQIREHVLRQKGQQALVLDEILLALDRAGIRLYADFGHDPALDAEIRKRLPEIRHIVRRSSEPPPNLLSERVHVFVRFTDAYAILTIQAREGRLMTLGSRHGQRRFALAERWLSARAAGFFPGREVVEAFPFKVLREADLRYRPDEEDTLEEQIAAAVQRRKRARVVRLEVDAQEYSEGALFLATSLGLDSAGLYRFDLPLDLRTLARIYQQAGERPGLRYPPVHPRVPVPFTQARRTFDLIRSHDILLHHPYDSFEPVIRFLKEAARDPKVRRIYHTMYRTSRLSPVMDALKDAAKRGKKVTAYVEIKARFDELNNLRWAQDLRQAGVRVVAPMGGFKVHSKLTQVYREEDGVERSYLHLGTGNYHPGTARQYTDLGLLTADQGLGIEIEEFFRALRQRRKPYAFRELLVAPRSLHPQVLRLIRDETRMQKSGVKGHIVAKMNALVDPDIIDALYQASSAGVRVELLVRGICCLRPGIKGLSENIRVVSVVDRFLEHSRVYYFHAGGAEKLYLSSADWMPRNFYSRYEIAFPVKDPALKQFVRGVILEGGLADTARSWQLQPDGGYDRVRPGDGARPLRSQLLFETLARRQYRGTILQYRVPG